MARHTEDLVSVGLQKEHAAVLGVKLDTLEERIRYMEGKRTLGDHHSGDDISRLERRIDKLTYILVSSMTILLLAQIALLAITFASF